MYFILVLYSQHVLLFRARVVILAIRSASQQLYRVTRFKGLARLIILSESLLFIAMRSHSRIWSGIVVFFCIEFRPFARAGGTAAALSQSSSGSSYTNRNGLA